jgi:protein phosphatase
MFSNGFFTFETGQATDVGRVRTVNEDSFLSRPEAGIWVVADGMGGHAAGDFASQTIVRELYAMGLPGAAEDLQSRFLDRLSRANDQILDHAEELNKGTIGATVAALLVYDEHCACIWSGDSRVYRLHHGTLSQMSRDHTEVQALLDAGAITPQDAVNWPRKNVITRAIGVSDTPQCDIVGAELYLGDTFVICSDGLTEHLSDDDISRFIRQFPPQEACDRMIDLPLSRGAKDNVTVIVMRCLPPAPVADDPTWDADLDNIE